MNNSIPTNPDRVAPPQTTEKPIEKEKGTRDEGTKIRGTEGEKIRESEVE
jgi:hypothetical protein